MKFEQYLLNNARVDINKEKYGVGSRKIKEEFFKEVSEVFEESGELGWLNDLKEIEECLKSSQLINFIDNQQVKAIAKEIMKSIDLLPSDFNQLSKGMLSLKNSNLRSSCSEDRIVSENNLVN